MPAIFNSPLLANASGEHLLQLMALLTLQLLGGVGVFTISLILLRSKYPRSNQQPQAGWILGLTGYCFSAAAAHFIGATHAPYIRHELLFLAALLGGWPSGLIAACITYTGRIQFGGTELWLFSAFETVIFVVAGALLHTWFARRDVAKIACKEVLLIATSKTALNGVCLLAIGLCWPEPILAAGFVDFQISRILAYPIFAISVYGLLLVMKMDAQTRHFKNAEIDQMKLRLQTAVEREQLLLGISHNLKTSLTRMRLRLGLLDDQPLKQDLEVELDAMIESVLDMLRSPDGREDIVPTRLDLLVQSLVAQPIYLNTQIETQLKPITLNLRPQSMTRALGNLLDNGILYGHKLVVNLFEEQQSAWLILRDFGPGVAESDIEKVFQPHVRLDYAAQVNAKGTGLGLSISRNVIRAHGGEIELRNHPQGGLELRVQLPLKPPA
jgi:signal transduction histidine kinase